MDTGEEQPMRAKAASAASGQAEMEINRVDTPKNSDKAISNEQPTTVPTDSAPAPSSAPPLDEIKFGLDFRHHKLFLKVNPSVDRWCQASRCLVAYTGLQRNKLISSKYYLTLLGNLPEAKASTRGSRYYHVSCFEETFAGVDLAGGIKAVADGALDIHFHPAILDWIQNAGKCYSHADYANEHFKLANLDYRILIPLFQEQQQSLPPRPTPAYFTSCHLEEKKLSDTLMIALDAAHPHLEAYFGRHPQRKLEVLEVRGCISANIANEAQREATPAPMSVADAVKMAMQGMNGVPNSIPNGYVPAWHP